MADVKGPTFNPISDLKSLVLFFALLWIAWLLNGGPANFEASQKPFLTAPVTRTENNLWQDPLIHQQYGYIPPTHVDANIELNNTKQSDQETKKQDTQPLLGESNIPVNDSSISTVTDNKQNIDNSHTFLQKPIIYLSKGLPSSSGFGYLKIDVPVFNKPPVVISGLIVKDLFGRSAIVGNASDLPYQGRINSENPVVVPPGSVIYLIEGSSPIGASFRVNKCIGYLSKFQNFYPPLPTLNDISATYNDCVDLHKNDSDFYLNDWRLYSGIKTKLWVEAGDVISIKDSAGNTLASSFY